MERSQNSLGFSVKKVKLHVPSKILHETYIAFYVNLISTQLMKPLIRLTSWIHTDSGYDFNIFLEAQHLNVCTYFYDVSVFDVVPPRQLLLSSQWAERFYHELSLQLMKLPSRQRSRQRRFFGIQSRTCFVCRALRLFQLQGRLGSWQRWCC